MYLVFPYFSAAQNGCSLGSAGQHTLDIHGSIAKVARDNLLELTRVARVFQRLFDVLLASVVLLSAMYQ